MKYQGRVRNWLGAWLLLGLAAALSSACGSSDGGGTGGGYCETLTGKQHSCGLLSDGKITGCTNYLDAAEPCETRCIEAATCADLVGYSCTGGSTSYIKCLAQCVGLAPLNCGDGTQLSGYSRCNGVSECADGSDESGCAVIGFKCRNVNQYAATGAYCDGKKDCSDGSDEPPDCAPGVRCAVQGSDTQLTVSSTCNGFVECDDKSDEPAGCATFTCPN